MMNRLALVMLVLLGVAGCGQPDARFLVEPQHWGDRIIEIETRPVPPRPGMNELLVLVTEERGRPVRDLIVSMRVKGETEWRQAIQDGYSGVYRRALSIPAAMPRLELELRRKRNDESVLLEFLIPLQP